MQGIHIKLVIPLAGATNVHVEHIAASTLDLVEVLVGMLCGVHAACTAAVGNAFVGVTGANAFDYCDGLWFLVVAGTLDVTFGGARCVYQAFELKTCDYIGVVSAAILSVDFCPVDKIVASGEDNGAERFGSGAIGIVVVDCAGGADFCAHATFALG